MSVNRSSGAAILCIDDNLDLLNLQESLYTILQVLSVSLFQRTSMSQLLTFYDYTNDTDKNLNQMNLFMDYSGQ